MPPTFYLKHIHVVLNYNIKLFVYCCRHPKQIDLFAGGLTEENVNGSLVGPTFECLIGKQFQALMFGDRFFYTNAKQFTKSEFVT